MLTIAQVAAHADECEALTAKVVANVRGATFDKISSSRLHYELKHPASAGVTVHCRLPPSAPPFGAEVPAAISVVAESAFPPASYFDLIGKAGSVLTGRPASAIRKNAMACHQRALAQTHKSAESTVDGIYYVCAAEAWGAITVQNGPPPP